MDPRSEEGAIIQDSFDLNKEGLRHRPLSGSLPSRVFNESNVLFVPKFHRYDWPKVG